jgi:hypothetical protein
MKILRIKNKDKYIKTTVRGNIRETKVLVDDIIITITTPSWIRFEFSKLKLRKRRRRCMI